MSIWLTSDHHFYHANVIKYCNRPFKTVEEMNEILVARWNEVVKPDDTVLYLGDFSMAARAAEVFLPRLMGKKELYCGNHDFPHPAHKKGRKESLRAEWTEKYLKFGFNSVQLEGKLEVPGVANFRLFHLPYSDPTDTHQDGKPRHFSERLPDDGVPLLCGHVHEKWLFRLTPRGTPQLNVGVDAPDAPWSGKFRPASLEEVVQVYLERTRS